MSEYIFELSVQDSSDDQLTSSETNGEELFISEYNEYSSTSDKYKEIFNAETESIYLADYEVWFSHEDDGRNWSSVSDYPVTEKLLFNACYVPSLNNDFGCSSLPESDCTDAPNCLWYNEECYSPDTKLVKGMVVLGIFIFPNFFLC